MPVRGRFAGRLPTAALLIAHAAARLSRLAGCGERVGGRRRHDDHDHRVGSSCPSPTRRVSRVTPISRRDRDRGSRRLLARPTPAATHRVRHLSPDRGARRDADAQQVPATTATAWPCPTPRTSDHGPRETGRRAGRRSVRPLSQRLPALPGVSRRADAPSRADGRRSTARSPLRRCRRAAGATRSRSVCRVTRWRCRTRRTGPPTHGWGGAARGSAVCTNCHEPNFCTSCHGMPMPHPADWGTAHPDMATKKPGECTLCHVQKDCDACHQIHQTHAKGGGHDASRRARP